MATVWVIEDGDYSDYHVIGVFTSREAAEKVRDAIKEGTIAEWPLDPAVAELNQGLTLWHVTMLRDGTVEKIGSQELSGYSVQREPFLWRRTQAAFYKGKGIPDALQSIVFAEDEKHAVKIVNETRLQMIALNRWEA